MIHDLTTMGNQFRTYMLNVSQREYFESASAFSEEYRYISSSERIFTMDRSTSSIKDISVHVVFSIEKFKNAVFLVNAIAQ